MKEATSAFTGLFVRRECWRLSWRGRLVAALLMVGMVIFAIFSVPPFLSPTAPLHGQFLIIEGWLPPSAMRQAAADCMASHYKNILIVRPLVDAEAESENGRYSGHYLATLLTRYGVRGAQIDCIFPSVAKRDRTYHEALAAKQWMAAEKIDAKSIDLMSLGPHARRSRLLFEDAFGDDYRIGIISLENMEYDQAHWWRTSEGVREVIGESIAYLYARFLFRPSTS